MNKYTFVIFTLVCLLLTSCISDSTVTVNDAPSVSATNTEIPITNLSIPPIAEGWSPSNHFISFTDMSVLPNTEVWTIGQYGLIIHNTLRYYSMGGFYDYYHSPNRGLLSSIFLFHQIMVG